MAHELGEAGDGKVAARDQHERIRGDVAERHEVAHRVVGQRLDERAVHDHVEDAADEHRVAVGGRARHVLGAHERARARAVLHDHALLEALAELLRQMAREDIGAAAGPDRHDEANGAAGIVLRRCRRGEPGQGKGDAGKTGNRAHDAAC
jgi:hypothetical protein